MSQFGKWSLVVETAALADKDDTCGWIGVSADRLACPPSRLLELLITEPADVASRSLGTAVEILRVCGAAAQVFGIDRCSISEYVNQQTWSVDMQSCMCVCEPTLASVLNDRSTEP